MQNICISPECQNAAALEQRNNNAARPPLERKLEEWPHGSATNNFKKAGLVNYGASVTQLERSVPGRGMLHLGRGNPSKDRTSTWYLGRYLSMPPKEQRTLCVKRFVYLSRIAHRTTVIHLVVRYKTGMTETGAKLGVGGAGEQWKFLERTQTQQVSH